MKSHGYLLFPAPTRKSCWSGSTRMPPSFLFVSGLALWSCAVESYQIAPVQSYLEGSAEARRAGGCARSLREIVRGVSVSGELSWWGRDGLLVGNHSLVCRLYRVSAGELFVTFNLSYLLTVTCYVTVKDTTTSNCKYDNWETKLYCTSCT